ncbi:hypothetical protein Pelo_7104 [Pelomyxa schiedti]|nr:hypothetical protein Pelo_7104 [Pelomyxa schiedti]
MSRNKATAVRFPAIPPDSSTTSTPPSSQSPPLARHQPAQQATHNRDEQPPACPPTTLLGARDRPHFCSPLHQASPTGGLRAHKSTPEAIMGGGGGVGLRLSATGDLPRGSISGSGSGYVYTHSRNQNNPGSYMNANVAETGPAEKPYRPTYSTTKKRFQSVAARAKAGGVNQAPKQPLLETPVLVISQPPASSAPSPPNSIPATTTEPGKTAALQPAVELDKVVSVSPPLGVKTPSVGDSISSTDAQAPTAPMLVTTGVPEEEKPKLNLREVAKHALYVKNSGGSTVDAKIIRRLNVTICDLQQQVRVIKTENLKLRKERDLLKTNLKHSQSRYVALQKKINPLDLPADEPLPNDEISPAEVPRTESPYEWTLKKEGGSIVAVMEATAPTKGPEPRPRKLTEQEQLKLQKNLEFLQSLALLFTKGGIVMGPSGAVNMKQAASSVPTPSASTPSPQAMKLIFTPAGTVYVPVEQIDQLPKPKNTKSAPRTTKPSTNTNTNTTSGTKAPPPTNNNKPLPAEPPQQPPQPQPQAHQQQEPNKQPPQAEPPVPQTLQVEKAEIPPPTTNSPKPGVIPTTSIPQPEQHIAAPLEQNNNQPLPEVIHTKTPAVPSESQPEPISHPTNNNTANSESGIQPHEKPNNDTINTQTPPSNQQSFTQEQPQPTPEPSNKEAKPSNNP